MGIFPILAFVGLCIIYGTSYAFVSSILGNVDEAALSCLRMIFACIATWAYFGYRYLHESNYKAEIHQSITSGKTPLGKAFFCGIFSLGVPITCITMAQSTVPSTVVTLSQPVIPLITMIIAHFLLKDEKISSSKLLLSLCDLVGAVLTIIPTFSASSMEAGSSSISEIIENYILLFVSIFCFAAGSIYLKVFLGDAELTLSCCCSATGATLYTLVSSVIRVGFSYLIDEITDMSAKYIIYTFILGVIYSCIPTFLFMYVVRTLGAVKANLTNFGQIVIGTFVGVVFLGEIKDYSRGQRALTYLGVVIIVVCLLVEFYQDSVQSKKPKYTDQESLIRNSNDYE